MEATTTTHFTDPEGKAGVEFEFGDNLIVTLEGNGAVTYRIRISKADEVIVTRGRNGWSYENLFDYESPYDAEDALEAAVSHAPESIRAAFKACEGHAIDYTLPTEWEPMEKLVPAPWTV